MNKLAMTILVSSATLLMMGADGVPPAADARAADALVPHVPTSERSATAAPTPSAATAYAYGGYGGTVGGPHDFTAFGGDACSACHVPHVQAIVPTTQPAATQPAVDMYRIPGQRQVFVPGRFMPGPSSLLCLGCHDGTVATSTIGSSHALLAGVREGFAVPEGFAWRDHPIGIPYPAGDREYRPASFVAKKLPLPDGRIECISCHDPHNVAGVNGLLWMSNRRSALCLTCHIK